MGMKDLGLAASAVSVEGVGRETCRMGILHGVTVPGPELTPEEEADLESRAEGIDALLEERDRLKQRRWIRTVLAPVDQPKRKLDGKQLAAGEGLDA